MTEFLDRRPGPAPTERAAPVHVEEAPRSAKRARSSTQDAAGDADMCLPCRSTPASEAAVAASAAASTETSEDEEHLLEGSACYIHSDSLLKAATKHPQHPMRTLLVHSLIEACGLLPHLEVVEECEVDRIDLTKFHSRAYVDFLRKPNAADQEECLRRPV